MGAEGLKGEWPLQRLLHMLNQMNSRVKNDLKTSFLKPTVDDKEISPANRDETLAWIAKLTVQFSFHPETFFLASSILDRFITSVKAQPKYLKCIAVSCFYLAMKICEEEDVIPCTGELVSDSQCGCRVCDVLRMERIILEKLSWDLQASTSLDYLHIFHMLACVHFTDLSKKLSLSRHLAVLTSHLMSAVSSYDIARFPNSSISLALLSLHLEAITKDPNIWTLVSRQLQSLAKIETSDFMMCRELLKSRLSSKFCERLDFLKKPPYLKPLADHQRNLAKDSHFGTSGVAMKRKASSPTNTGDSPRKPHPKICFVERMEDCDCESDETMTASEAEMEVEEIVPQQSHESTRRLTYAEIVKSGLDSTAVVPPVSSGVSIGTSGAYGVSSCGFQASYGFLSPASHHGSVGGIRT